MEKYSVDYISAPTGYGWEKEVKTLEEVITLIDGLTKEPTTKITVFDRTLHDYIFYKDAYQYEPSIDIIFNGIRDFRTTTRKRLIFSN